MRGRQRKISSIAWFTPIAKIAPSLNQEPGIPTNSPIQMVEMKHLGHRLLFQLHQQSWDGAKRLG